jgi:glutathione S-transferase
VWFDEVADTVQIPAGAAIGGNRFLRAKIFGTEGDDAAAKAGEEAILKPLDYLESAVSGDGWLDASFSLGDISVASCIRTLGYTGWSLDSGRHPKLAAWYGRVSQRAAWQQAAEEEAAIFASLQG